MYGETTAAFIAHLKANGPQTSKQLEAFQFWGGVRTRIGVLIKQGRVVKVSVANPYAARYSRAVVAAYKATDNTAPARVGRMQRGGETYVERVRREKKERAVARAIVLLEQQGYKVLPPNAK